MRNQASDAVLSASYVELLRELVDAVYEYGYIDEDWTHSSTMEATRGRERMYAAARKIMLEMSGCTLSDDQIDRVFGWQSER